MKNFTQQSFLKNELNMEAKYDVDRLHIPSDQSIKFILAYSKSIEARRSKHINDMLLNLN
jgi:hypothetical protein